MDPPIISKHIIDLILVNDFTIVRLCYDDSEIIH